MSGPTVTPESLIADVDKELSTLRAEMLSGKERVKDLNRAIDRLLDTRLVLMKARDMGRKEPTT